VPKPSCHFLQYLEQERHNKVQTRNARLAAIDAFMNYAVAKEPQALADIQQVLAIPQKRADQFTFEYLERDEVEALLKGLDQTSWFGQRDHALFQVLYNTGGRVSEVACIQFKDIDLHRQNVIHFYGKGRKERIVPLWPQTIKALEKWQVRIKATPESPVFPNRYGVAISRFGVAQRLKSAIKRAIKTCPSLKGRKITPHTFRHTTAMHMLQSGVKLTVISLWLGHEKIETTHDYMKADLEMKRNALSMLPPVGEQGEFEPIKITEDILTFLENL